MLTYFLFQIILPFSIFTVSVITAILEYTSVHIGSINTVTTLCVLVYYVYLSTQTVYRWERGERIPDVITFMHIAKVLGITAEKLIYF